MSWTTFGMDLFRTLIIELFFGSILHLISPPNGSKQFQRGPVRYPRAHEKPHNKRTNEQTNKATNEPTNE